MGLSLLTLFTITTLENWNTVLFYTQQVMGPHTIIIFAAIIMTGKPCCVQHVRCQPWEQYL